MKFETGRLDYSPLEVKFQFFDEHFRPFHMEIPPRTPGNSFLIVKYSLSALKSAGLVFYTTKVHVAGTYSNDKIMYCSLKGTCIRPEMLLLVTCLFHRLIDSEEE